MSDDDRIYVLGANWCGFTQKAFSEIADDDDRFVKLDCAGADKDHALCQDVNAFPTFKRHDAVCHRGYGAMDDVLTACAPPAPLDVAAQGT